MKNSKKTEYQKFVDFKKRNGLTTQDIQRMISDYANSGPDFACSHFMQKYGLSEHAFYRARDFAVTCGLLDYRTTERTIAKAAFNSKQRNSKKNSTQSLLHSQELKKLREDFFNSFSKEEIIDICRKYAEGISVDKIAVAYDTGTYMIKQLLSKGIILRYIDDSIFAAISLRLKAKGRSINEVFSVFGKH